MQENLVAASDVVQIEHAKAAVDALTQIVMDRTGFGKERIQAAEILLRYGVQDPYWPGSQPVEGEG